MSVCTTGPMPLGVIVPSTRDPATAGPVRIIWAAHKTGFLRPPSPADRRGGRGPVAGPTQSSLGTQYGSVSAVCDVGRKSASGGPRVSVSAPPRVQWDRRHRDRQPCPTPARGWRPKVCVVHRRHRSGAHRESGVLGSSCSTRNGCTRCTTAPCCANVRVATTGSRNLHLTTVVIVEDVLRHIAGEVFPIPVRMSREALLRAPAGIPQWTTIMVIAALYDGHPPLSPSAQRLQPSR